VRDELLKKLKAELLVGAATVIWSYPNPQGYCYETIGNPTRKLEDFEGLALIRIKEDAGRKTK